MNIAFVCNTLHGGGAERFTANIANSFSRQTSNSVFVITGKALDNDYSLNENVCRLDFLTKNLFKDFRLVLRAVKNYKIERLVGIDIYPNFVVSLCAKFTKAKCIISERNAPKQVNISKKSRLLRWILYRFADGYVFQTSGAKEFYSKKIQKKSTVIHNPIRENLPAKSDVNNKEIVAVGRLNVQKNYPMLIHAFAVVHENFPEYRLRIFGEGELRDSLEELSKEAGVFDSVSFEGFTLNVHEAIKDSYIFVMTSDFEGMPNALMEAMAMGFPVVSTDCPSGGPGELITDGKNGLLCPVGDYEAFAQKIMTVLENKTFCENLSFEAKKITDSHNSDVIFQRWNEFVK